MATELETKTKVTTDNGNRRLFFGLSDGTRTSTYKRPEFSKLDFDTIDVPQKYDTTQQLDEPQQQGTNLLTIEKNIEQHPEVSVRPKLNARGKILIGMITICICALIAFMIGNAVTISAIASQIGYKEQVVAAQQTELSMSQQQLEDMDAQYNEEYFEQNGYLGSSNVVEIAETPTITKPTATIEGNWFDSFCNWLSGIFR